MKNVLNNTRKGILMVAMFTTLLSFANEVSVSKAKNEAKRTSLTLKNVKQGNLLSIKDNQGIVLYKELIEKTGSYTKGFDLTDLPNGSYTFEIDKDVEISTIPFKVAAEGVTFNKEAEHIVYKPITKVVGDLLYITKLSLEETPLEINIFFEDNSTASLLEEIYTETVEHSKIIQKVYKLEGLSQGTYEVICNTDGRSFTTYIK